MQNDILKINKYQTGLIIIDRGMISTLSYNETLNELIGNDELEKIYEWFNKYGKKFYDQDNVMTIYLKTSKYKLRYSNYKDPYGSIDNQKLLESFTLNNIEKYCKNYRIIDYEYKDMEKIINEIIN